MLVFISFFIFVFLVVLLILIFCNIKRKKKSANTILNNHKVHFKLSLFKNLYAEFDYEINSNNRSSNNKDNISNT